MCKTLKKITQNHFGQLAKCSTCNVYHLSFNNILFEFTQEELTSFRSFLNSIDTNFWVKNYADKKRSIPIRTLQQNLYLQFSKKEINALKYLVLNKKNITNEFISYEKIDYGIHSN